MQRVVVVLGAYGFLSFLPVLLFFQPYLSRPSPLQPLRYGDLLDIALTPLVGVGTFALLYRLLPAISKADDRGRPLFRALFWAFSILYLEGHGMHLAADSIASNLTFQSPAKLQQAVYFFDELISHVLWFGAAVCLALLTVAYQSIHFADRTCGQRAIVLLVGSGVLYGTGFGLFMIEGQTAVWLTPVVLVGTLWMAYEWLNDFTGIGKRPALVFFLSGFVSLLLIVVIWAVRFGGFVQPSSVVHIPNIGVR